MSVAVLRGKCSEFCPAYYEGLVGATRARYETKTKLCDGVDPYTLRVGADATADVELLPATTQVDIINYLVLSTSYVTLQQMKVYKSLDAHNYFTSGWVRNIAAMRLQSERVIVLGEVSHSQRLREPDLKVWCLANTDGSIITAHCTCMAGAGEACSHIGAVLFAVETSVRLRETRTCTGRKNAWLPANCSGTQPKRLRDIDFSSSKMRKRKMDSIHLQQGVEITSTCLPQALPLAPTEESIQLFHSRLADAGATPAVFMVHPRSSVRGLGNTD
ncbi:uncharacterized protein [Dermacentor andersoni]|uniref:uncharacterized protein n=1 Tax=Dermacentor andersoni TaxID=34620 RepID=UPI003B3AC7D2